MIEIDSFAEKTEASASLTLPFEMRQKSRFKTRLDDGREAGVILPRGHLLRGGDCVKTVDGEIIEIKAADETVSTVYSEQPLQLARASYHLGNRHVHLQISENFVRYLHDHVLDEMITGLGMQVTVEEAEFEPEAGAYGGHSHAHGHSHSHGEAPEHSYAHEHSHSHQHTHEH